MDYVVSSFLAQFIVIRRGVIKRFEEGAENVPSFSCSVFRCIRLLVGSWEIGWW